MRVGLTGGIASGKSTVAATLAEHGAVIIDADAIAHQVVAKGTAGLERVVEAFGDQVLTPEGEMDRPKVGEIVFNDPEKRKVLEGIVHPLVFERIVELEQGAPEDAIVVHDIPLLAETGVANTFDAVVVVEAPEDLQVQRMLRDRAMSEEEARSRIAAQSGPEARRAIATYLVENTGSLEDLRQRVTEVFESLSSRS